MPGSTFEPHTLDTATTDALDLAIETLLGQQHSSDDPLVYLHCMGRLIELLDDDDRLDIEQSAIIQQLEHLRSNLKELHQRAIDAKTIYSRRFGPEDKLDPLILFGHDQVDIHLLLVEQRQVEEQLKRTALTDGQLSLIMESMRLRHLVRGKLAFGEQVITLGNIRKQSAV